MFRWFCPSTFCFAWHQHDTLGSLFPGTRGMAIPPLILMTKVQGTNPDMGSLCNLFVLVLMSLCWQVPRIKDKTTGRSNYNPALSVSVVLVPRKANFFYVPSALQLSLIFFSPIKFVWIWILIEKETFFLGKVEGKWIKVLKTLAVAFSVFDFYPFSGKQLKTVEGEFLLNGQTHVDRRTDNR